MNCRRFERQTADWLSRRLPSERSEEMTAHQKTCAACATAAAAEARLRALWRDGVGAPPVADLWPHLWPHLLTRLDAPAAKATVGAGQGGPRARTGWPARALAAAVILGVFYGAALLRPRTPAQSLSGQIATAPSERWAQPALPRDPWTALRDVAHSDPLVDDPVGANMEDIWTYLKTGNK